uniref:Uncharacterized protein n=1 Tax=Romanomermis culicivorax TaxID=13658 RepID=A0A915JRL2_ROMCU
MISDTSINFASSKGEDSAADQKYESSDGGATGGGGKISGDEVPYKPLRPTHIDIKNPTTRKM